MACILVSMAVASVGLGGPGESATFYGEPVELQSDFIYFTSWKYVRQGGFTWKVEHAPDASEEEKNIGTWLAGDSDLPARFITRDMPRGIRLVAQKARLVPFEPGQIAAQVYDEGKFKSWYTIGPSSEPEAFSTKEQILPGYNSHLAYAESEDGIHWEFPHLGLYEFGGTKDNNIVFRGDLDGSTRGYHGGTVFVDPSSVEERYKMFYLGLITDKEWEAFEAKYPGEADTMARRQDVNGFRCVVAVFGAVSPDGLHWTSIEEPLMIQHADTLNSCYYDEQRGEYVAYVRAWQVNPKAEGMDAINPDGWIEVGRRSIGRSFSKDFRHFTPPEIVMTTGADMAPSHVFYTNCKTTLPGIPDNHVMFPWIWELESDGGGCVLLSSQDGAHWSRVPGGNVVDQGPPGSPTGGMIVCSNHLLEYPDGSWGINYGGNPIPHKYPGRDVTKRKGLFPGVEGESGRALWPKGRLVALDCPEEGEFATVAVVPRGERIRLNASILPSGYIQMAVRKFGSGEDLPGRGFEDADRLLGDDLAMPVTWKGEEEIGHSGEPILFRFRMRQAKLFGIEFD
jgi:hypothetical protein